MRKLNMTYKYLEFVVEEGLATITLNRPKRLNALSAGMIDELYEAVTHVATDSDIKAVLITGAGKGFCSGADISVAPEKNAEFLMQQAERAYDAMIRRYNPIIQTIHDMGCLLYTSPSPRDLSTSRMPSSA